ncbi:hypothetical protein KVT40_004907 [Elsinoe batatas]|uniref:Ankyrin repeat-containing protein n=1 Tax=Elsinoe batatas TaxID=2601811 RepID=A0A8K0L0H1_9PEZI|nr:hypothetical protein KVT40_004907 [Elsinoe batatas]
MTSSDRDETSQDDESQEGDETQEDTEGQEEDESLDDYEKSEDDDESEQSDGTQDGLMFGEAVFINVLSPRDLEELARDPQLYEALDSKLAQGAASFGEIKHHFGAQRIAMPDDFPDVQVDTIGPDLVILNDPHPDTGSEQIRTFAKSAKIMLTESLEFSDDFGRGALHLAVLNGSVEILEFFINRRWVPDAYSQLYGTPVSLAAALDRPQLDSELVAECLQRGFQPDVTATFSLADWRKLVAAERDLLDGAASWIDIDLEHARSKLWSVRDEILSIAGPPIVLAAYIGHRDIVQMLLQYGPSLNCMARVHLAAFRPLEMTWVDVPLIGLVARSHCSNMVPFLLATGADPSKKSSEGMQAVHLATVADILPNLICIIEHSEDKSLEKEAASSLLHRAVRHMSPTCATYLLSRDVSLEWKDNEPERAALFCACAYGDVAMVKLLIEHGAEIDTKDNKGATPLMLCTIPSDVLCFRVLLEAHADVNKVRHSNNWTALHWAVNEKRVEHVSLLLEHGAETKHLSDDHETALCKACTEGNMECVVRLVEHGANVNPERQNRLAKIPLREAVYQEATDIVQYLVDRGADLAARDQEGRTALQVACIEGYTWGVSFLLSKGAHAREVIAETDPRALFEVIDNGYIDCLAALLEAGPPPARDDMVLGKAVLRAAEKGSVACLLRTLLRYNLDPSVRDLYGRTPLVLAVANDNIECMNVVLEARDVGRCGS